jgi:hypothetical protein
MSSTLMLVNPSKRRKSHRSPAQKAATRRMIAARGGKRHSNPHRRKRHAVAVRRSNPIRHRVHHAIRRHKRRHNPIGLTAGGIGGMMMNGLKGAGGAIVVNVVTNYLPDAVKTGNVVYATRAALAIVMGTVGRKMLGSNARVMAEGALVVNFHDFINSIAGAMLPGSQLHEYVGTASMLPQASGGTVYDTELHGMGEYLYR